MDLPKKVLVGGSSAIATLIIVIVFASWPHEHRRGHQCIASRDKPDINAIKIDNIVSPDNSTLANLAGYVHFADDTYMTLDIRSLDAGDRRIRLVGTCFNININLSRVAGSDKGRRYSYDNVVMRTKSDTDTDDSPPKHICVVDRQVITDHLAELRYSCTRERHFKCLDIANGTQKLVASLVLKSFELELDRDPKTVNKLSWTKKIWAGSCGA